MKIVGIMLWIVGALWTFGFMYAIREDERSGKGSTKASVNMTMLFAVSLVIIPILDLSPFHLLWMFPASWGVGFLSLVFPFSLLSIPGWLFGNLCCLGVDPERSPKKQARL